MLIHRRSPLPLLVACLAGLGGGLVAAPARAVDHRDREERPTATEVSTTAKMSALKPVSAPDVGPPKPKREELRRIRQRMYVQAKRAGHRRQFNRILRDVAENNIEGAKLEIALLRNGLWDDPPVDELAPWFVYLEAIVNASAVAS